MKNARKLLLEILDNEKQVSKLQNDRLDKINELIDFLIKNEGLKWNTKGR